MATSEASSEVKSKEKKHRKRMKALYSQIKEQVNFRLCSSEPKIHVMYSNHFSLVVSKLVCVFFVDQKLQNGHHSRKQF